VAVRRRAAPLALLLAAALVEPVQRIWSWPADRTCRSACADDDLALQTTADSVVRCVDEGMSLNFSG
jgi:hypothetical protein